MELTLDNSALSLLSCQRKFQLTVIDGLYTPRDVTLQIGDLFHKAIEQIHKGDDFTETYNKGIAANPKVNKLLAINLLTAFILTQKLPPPIADDNGEPFIEKKFKYRYKSLIIQPSNESLDINLAGTMDRVQIEPKDDTLEFVDYKTGVDATDYSIAKKLSEYELSFQLPFYVYCALHSGILPAKYKEYVTQRRYRVIIYFAFYNCKPPKFVKLVKNSFNDDFLYREVPLIINSRISDAVNIYQLKSTPAPHDGMNVYKACSYCQFRPACLAMGTAREDELLSRFLKREYDPLTFR